MPVEAAEASSSAAAATEGSLHSVASPLRAPEGMAFAVEHNHGDRSHTLRLMPEIEASHRWPTATAQQWVFAPVGVLRSRSRRARGDVPPIVERLLFQWCLELIRWLCSFVIIGTGLAMIAKRPFLRPTSYIAFNVFLACFHSVGAFAGKLRPRTPSTAKPATSYICFVAVDCIFSIAGMGLMWKAESSIRSGTGLIAAGTSTLSAATFFATIGNIIGLSTGDYSPEDLKLAYNYPPNPKRPKATGDVELDTFSRRHADEAQGDEEEGEVSDDAGSTSGKAEEEAAMLLHNYLGFTAVLHDVQCIMCLPIFAISAAVAAQNRYELHYTAAFNTFISGTICTYLPFFNVITASPSRARASNYYLAFVVASLVITSIANILMWHIYSTERYMPAAFAGWAGFIVAFCSAYELKWLVVLQDKDYTAEQMKVAYFNAHLHCSFLAKTGLRSKFFEHPDTWVMQFVFSMFALFFSSYEVATRPEKNVHDALVFNLVLASIRLFAVRSDVWILAPMDSEKPTILYRAITGGNLLLAIMAMISALIVHSSELSYSLIMTRMADIGIVIIAAVDVGMTVREYRNPREGHDYQEVGNDEDNEALLATTFAVGSDDEDEGPKIHDEDEEEERLQKHHDSGE